MIRRLPVAAAFLLAAVAILVMAPACSRALARPHASLTDGVEPLRSDFNRDAGRVRIVMVPAPT